MFNYFAYTKAFSFIFTICILTDARAEVMCQLVTYLVYGPVLRVISVFDL